jgi:membrane-associated phospholipid phosphatase
LVGLWATVLYATVGAVAMTLSPRVLPFVVADDWIPLMPWTFWIYATVYFIYAVACIIQDDMNCLRDFLHGYIIANLISSAVFLIFPTTFPRELFALSQQEQAHSFSAQALAWFRAFDKATNCFPSMHVACAVLSALGFYGRRPRTFLILSLWALAIALATMSTKQHYFVDVISGLLLGVASYRLAASLSRAPAPAPVST